MLEPYPIIGIILILALPAVSLDIPKQPLLANIDNILSMHDPQNVDVGFSSWATIGYVNDVSENRERSHVIVDFFPNEFCQAARVCITESQSFTKDEKLTIKENLCNEYINYNPPTGAFEAKIDGKTTKGFIGVFKLTASKTTRKLNYSTDPFWISRIYTEVKTLDVSMTNKMFLILTNSRQCHSRVRVDGKISSLNVIQEFGLKDTTLPEVFTYAHSGTKSKTIYTGTGLSGKRTADFLHQLKALKTQKFQIGHKKYNCEFAGIGAPKNSIITKTSVTQVSRKKSKQGAGNQEEWKISLDVTDCHWLRIWFADGNLDWSKYATDFKPENSVDFFFSEGFILLPDRENSVPLQLSSDSIRTITFRRHGDDLIELLLGHSDTPYPVVFKSNILKKDEGTVFMIRSPHCDASFRNNAPGTLTIQKDKKLNRVLITQCLAYSIEGTR